jgi:hypothetical protein
MLFLLRECHLVEEEDEIWMLNTTELQVETINKLFAFLKPKYHRGR